MIKITALQNQLPTVTKRYVAHIADRQHIGFDEFIGTMASGRTTVTKTDIVANMQLFFEELIKELVKGASIKVPLGTFYMSVSGTFDDVDQPFVYGDKEYGHDFRLHFRPDRATEISIAQSIKSCREKQIDRTAPCIFMAHSVRTDEELTTSPGDFVYISGQYMKFDKHMPEQGIWFRNGSECRSEQYAAITPGFVIAQVPPGIEPGEYTVCIRTSPNDKDIKEGRLSEKIVIYQ